jgi:hypothetical protein
MLSSVPAAVSTVMGKIVAVVATVNTTLKATEEARKVLERTSARAIARLSVNQAIRPRTAELTPQQLLQSRPLQPSQNQSCQEKTRPSDTFLSGAGPCLIKQRGPWQRAFAATTNSFGRLTDRLQ